MVDSRKLEQYDVCLVSLDPTFGSEIKKTRPCLIVSPDEMNRHIKTLIIAPMTTKARSYPTRVPVSFQGKEGEVVLDQIRTVDKQRIVKKLGKLSKATSQKVSSVLVTMFS